MMATLRRSSRKPLPLDIDSRSGDASLVARIALEARRTDKQWVAVTNIAAKRINVEAMSDRSCCISLPRATCVVAR